MFRKIFQWAKEAFSGRPQSKLDIQEELRKFREQRETLRANHMESIHELMLAPLRFHRSFLAECETNRLMFNYEWGCFRDSLRSRKRLDVTSKKVAWRLKRMRDSWEEHFSDTCSDLKDRLELICKLEGAEKDAALMDLCDTLGIMLHEKAEPTTITKLREEANPTTHSLAANRGVLC